MIGPAHFIDNKYRRWYFRLCERAKYKEKPPRGFEHHHILPKSLGGVDAKANVAVLTFRQHFIAHWLLIKFCNGAAKRKMSLALWAMTRTAGTRIVASWQYERARIAQHEAVLGARRSEETKARISEAKRRVGPETRAKLSFAAKNRSIEWREAISAGNRARVVTEGARQNMRAAGIRRSHRPEHSKKLMGHSVSEATREKMSEARRQYWTSQRAAGPIKQSKEHIAKRMASIAARKAKRS